MLILNRAISESIMIGGDIEVMVTGVHRQNGKLRVKIGIKAPREIPIFRKELAIRIARERLGLENKESKSA